MKTSTIASHYVRAVITAAQAHGLDAHHFLEKAGIGTEILDEPKARIFPEKMAKLLYLLATELNDECFGQNDKKMPQGSFDIMCQLILPCATLKDALSLAARYIQLFDFALEAQFSMNETSGDIIMLEKRPCLNADKFLTEFQLMTWHRLACWLTGKRIPIQVVEFDFDRPAHFEEYQLLFFGQHRFNQAKNLIRIEKQYLDLPIIRNREEDLPELMKEAPYAFLVRPNNTASINAQIRSILESNLDPEMPDFESVAFQLNTSTQTLRRRLKDENTSFQAIKDHVRRDLAIYYLSDNKLSINDIALKVGFTEPSTFHRAFKKWTGVTPGDYRK